MSGKPSNKVSSSITNPWNQNTSQWICQLDMKLPKVKKSYHICIYVHGCQLLGSSCKQIFQQFTSNDKCCLIDYLGSPWAANV